MKSQQQRTLLTLSKVVRLDASQVCFTAADIAALRTTLLDEQSSRHDLLCALRKLDCYRLELADLASTGVGGAVATLTAHPKPDVARFAVALLDKLRSVADRALFPRLPYDVDAAAAAPEGSAQTPEEAAQFAALAARAARRQRQLEAEAHFLDTSSSSDDEDEHGGTGHRGGSQARCDDEWRPSVASCRAATAAAGAPNPTGGSSQQPMSVTVHPLAAKFAPDSAFRKTRAGSRVPQGVEPGSDGRMYRQATLAAAFGGSGAQQRNTTFGAAKPSETHSKPEPVGGAGVIVEEDLVVLDARTSNTAAGEQNPCADEPMAIEIM